MSFGMKGDGICGSGTVRLAGQEQGSGAGESTEETYSWFLKYTATGHRAQ